ncbi:MAG TPA: hypothetical protein VJS92_02390, partial [Candidatus Polarisedimenticolaceae bacterium]|nr:hypothetical protein [Candidatus Polarisedimenticolaceae bacterium]
RRKPIRRCSAGELGLLADELGRGAARVDYLGLRLPPRSKAVEWIEGNPDDAARALIEKLRDAGRLS